MLLAALLVTPTGCGGAGHKGAEPEAPATPTSGAPVATSPSPVAPAPVAPALSVRTLATQPVPLTSQGLALVGDHVAWVQDEHDLVWTSWRTGDRRTVYRSQLGALYLLEDVGRYRHLVDLPPTPEGDAPDAPRRYLTLDMLTGQVTASDYPRDATLVGQLNDAQIEVVHPRHADGSEGQAADLYLVDQQPRPDVPRRRVTSSRRVVEASWDRHHRVVWTERGGRGSDQPATVWTADLFQAQQAPQQVATLGGAPSAPVAGTGWLAWVEDDSHLVLAPTAGGPATRVPGHVAVAGVPSAYGRVLAVVVSRHGHDELRVVRIDAR